MGFRFRKTIPIGKAFRINLSRRGIGASASIPGTGLSWGISPGRRKAGKAGESQGCLGCITSGAILLFCAIMISSCIAVLKGPSPDVPSTGDQEAGPVIPPAAYQSAPPPIREVSPPIRRPDPAGPSLPGPSYDHLLKPGGSSFTSRAPADAGESTATVPQPEPADPRAASILQLGKNHERDGRVKAAVQCFSEVVNGFPGTPEAAEAKSRITFLGSKVDPKAMPSKIVTPHSSAAPRHRRAPDFSGTDSDTGSMGISGGSVGGSSLCGAMTQSGAPCRNPVAGGGYCHLHR